MSRKTSIHLGLNRPPYGTYSWLASPENNATAIADLARAHKFSSPTVLNGTSATAANLFAALERESSSLTAGDVLWISYSGHGDQIPDRDGDEPYDQTWCCYDHPVVDDQINWYLTRFAADVRILVIGDHCYSGSVVSNITAIGSLWKRYAPATFSGAGSATPAALDPCAKSIWHKQARGRDPIKASVLLLASTRDDQVAPAGSLISPFTKALIDQSASAADYCELIKGINGQIGGESAALIYGIGQPNDSFLTSKPFVF